MCGRYTLTSPDDIAARFGLGALSETGLDIRPRFNISPSQAVLVIRSHDGETALELMRCGFQPAWMKGKSNRPPVILTEHGERLWMDQDAPPEEALSVLAPYPADLMGAFAVSTAVNSSGQDAPEMVEPLAP